MNGGTIHNICNRLQVGLFACILALASHLWAARDERRPPPLNPTTSITDLMIHQVMPRATPIFEAVSVSNTAAGEQVRTPQTDGEWRQLRAHALALVESANLLRIPGRRISHGAQHVRVPTSPRLTIRQLQRIVDLDRERWHRRVDAL